MSFDSLAPYYRPMEWLLAGSVLQRCRTAFLREVVQSRSALLLGEGPGRYLLELLRINPTVQVTCVDSSARMQEIARKRAGQAGVANGRVRYVCSDWTEWPGAGGPFDLIVTHFFLDCFRADQLAELVAKMSALTSSGGLWVVSDFAVPARGWQRLRAKIVLKLAYTFFRLATGLSASGLVPIDALLESAGFELRDRRWFNHQLVHTDLWRLRSLASGAQPVPFAS